MAAPCVPAAAMTAATSDGGTAGLAPSWMRTTRSPPSSGTAASSEQAALQDWRAAHPAGPAFQLIGADEQGEVEVAGCDLTGPSVLLVGNESTGLSAAWRQAADRMVRIPMAGSASSLNAATAASILLYEATRQRRPGPP